LKQEIDANNQKIQDAIDYVQFNVDEIVALSKECIDEGFDKEVLVNVDALKDECVGKNLHIINRVF